MVEQKLCTVIRPDLQKFCDGELQKERAAFVREHLMDCLNCRAIAGEVYRVRRFFEAASQTQILPPADFASRVTALTAQVGFNEQPVKQLLSFVKLLSGIAAALILLVGGYFWTGQNSFSASGIGVRAKSLQDIDQEIEAMRKEREKKQRQQKQQQAASRQAK